MICSSGYCRQKASNSDSDFCSNALCGNDEGDCDSDHECEGALICGAKNCPYGREGFDCCTAQQVDKFWKYKGTWITYLLFRRYHNCTNDSECTDPLICDQRKGICRKKADNTDEDFCRLSGRYLCRDGEGGCNNASDCEGSLVCGYRNCMGSVKTCCTQK